MRRAERLQRGQTGSDCDRASPTPSWALSPAGVKGGDRAGSCATVRRVGE